MKVAKLRSPEKQTFLPNNIIAVLYSALSLDPIHIPCYLSLYIYSLSKAHTHSLSHTRSLHIHQSSPRASLISLFVWSGNLWVVFKVKGWVDLPIWLLISWSRKNDQSGAGSVPWPWLQLINFHPWPRVPSRSMLRAHSMEMGEKSALPDEDSYRPFLIRERVRFHTASEPL